jgi:NitT/TauT family transport system ATP-binding protein
MPDFLSLRNIRKSFNTIDGPLTVIDGVSIDQGEGEVVSIVGASGSGKTTLLRIVAGLDVADSGTVTLRNHRVAGPAPERAMVFQQFGLLPWLTVIDNIIFALRPSGLSPAASKERAKDVLARVGLSGFERFHPKELSGGMQQRVGIARALAVKPILMLCDEPFAAVDALTRQVMQTDLQRVVHEENRSVLLVTHDIEEAIFLGDRVIVMSSRPARVMETVPVAIPRPRDHAVRTTSEFQALREAIWEKLQHCGEPISLRAAGV